MNINPLISLQGFDYLLEQLKNQNNSKRTLSGLRDALYSEQLDFLPTEESQDRKQIQIKTLIHILKSRGFLGPILEIGCGDGQLSRTLSREYDEDITAVDINEKLIEKNKTRNKKQNLVYVCNNAFDYTPNTPPKTILGLHCCGNLTERLVDLSARFKSNLVCFPCCYGKIKSNVPRSQTLSDRKEDFEEVIERAKSLEGYVDERESAKPNVILEIYRRLTDFDRIFYLTENGQNPYFLRVNVRGFNSSLRSAIIV